jgi:hypothetical protein
MRDSLVWKILLVCWAAAFLESCTKPPTQENVQWADYSLREVRTIRELPTGVQALLGVGRPGLQGIADLNGKYNLTDDVVSRLPMRRFRIAGLDADSALVAIEYGGFGSGVEVILFSNTYQMPTAARKWELFGAPKTLRELVDRLR